MICSVLREYILISGWYEDKHWIRLKLSNQLYTFLHVENILTLKSIKDPNNWYKMLLIGFGCILLINYENALNTWKYGWIVYLEF